MEWLQEHPYLAGGLVLAVIVLFLVLRGRSSASTSTVQAGPSDALQAASLQAQVQQQSIQAAADVQGQQTGAALAGHLADVQAQLAAISAARDVGLQGILSGAATTQYQAAAGLAAVQSTNLAQTDIADTAVAGSVSIAGIQANRDIQLAGIQAPISLASIQASLDAIKNTNATGVDIAGINANAATAISGQQTGAAVVISGQQETTKQLGIQTGGQVATTLINAQPGIIAAQSVVPLASINQYGTTVQQAYGALPGIGGSPNRVAVIAATLNQPSIGTAAEGSSATSAAAGSSVWSSFWQGLFGAAPKVIQAVAP